MYCPKCKSEYREGFTHCKDCDVELVEGSLEPEAVEPAPDRQKLGPMRALSANIDKWLRVGGIVVVLVGVVQAVLGMVPMISSSPAGMDLQPMFGRVSGVLDALASLPSVILTGFGYFALGEIISLLRKAEAKS